MENTAYQNAQSLSKMITSMGLDKPLDVDLSFASKESLYEAWRIYGRDSAPIMEANFITLYAKPCTLKAKDGSLYEAVEYWFENSRGNQVAGFEGGFVEKGSYETAAFDVFERMRCYGFIRDSKAKAIVHETTTALPRMQLR